MIREKKRKLPLLGRIGPGGDAEAAFLGGKAAFTSGKNDPAPAAISAPVSSPSL